MKLEKCENGHLYNAGRYKTCPYCNDERLEMIEEEDAKPIDFVEQDDDKTTASWEDKMAVDPVVGWLVCYDGYEKGKDYKIKAEKNFIGRESEMDICITGDSAISRKNHATLAYNPKTREYYLSPGEGNGLVYVQGNAVYAPVKIESHDNIEMGASKFIFVALCGDSFDWKID